MKTYRPNVVFLMETKSHEGNIENISRRLGFAKCDFVETNGIGKGILFMWKE